jgi:DNA-binding response OmpR family regulator
MMSCLDASEDWRTLVIDEGNCRMRVLIVDDYPDTAEAAGELLRTCGHECWSSASGAEALAVAEAFSPELAILDIGLPDINGYELIGALRARLAKCPPYFVAMTGWSGAVKRARDAGFDHFLLKPAGRKQLLCAVELAQRRIASPSTCTGRLIHVCSHREAGPTVTLQDASGDLSLGSSIG